jgi:cyclopropane-fatty-acyl-phospholipid synthase
LPFLARNVFPGSALPRISDIQSAIVDLYEIRELRTIGLDYSRTLTEWRERLRASRAEVGYRYGKDLLEYF